MAHQNWEQESRVLIADDDQSIRQLVRTIIRREGIEVDCAVDGQDAIEKLQQNEYAVILLDLMMPRVDGHGVLRFLETERPDPAPPVIIMTANVQSAFETATVGPVFRVLSKPFDIRQLVTHVRECISPTPA